MVGRASLGTRRACSKLYCCGSVALQRPRRRRIPAALGQGSRGCRDAERNLVMPGVALSPWAGARHDKPSWPD